ncbi:MAG: hypothetical protein ABIP03_14930 [Aquihabitans sp.]
MGGLAFALAFFVTVLTVPLAGRLARAGLVDIPTERSMHGSVVPRAGGAAMIVGVSLGAPVAVLAGADKTLLIIAGVAILLGAVGLLDDRFNLPGLPRMAAQVFVGAVILDLIADQSSGPGPGWPPAVGAAAILLWTLGITNAVNFMDGVNGLTGTLTVVFCVHLALLGAPAPVLVVPCVLLAAGTIGYLPANFASGRVFLGDGGAYFIGAWLAAVVVLAVQRGLAPALVVAPFAVYALDTSIALANRIRRGEALLLGHRDHVYQRVVLGGWSHTQSTLLVAVTASVCAGSAQLVDRGILAPLPGLVVGASALAGYLAAPRLQLRRQSLVT